MGVSRAGKVRPVCVLPGINAGEKMNQDMSQSPFNSISQTQPSSPYTQPTFIPYPTPSTNWFPMKQPTIEDRLANIERELKELKEMIEWIKWRV